MKQISLKKKGIYHIGDKENINKKREECRFVFDFDCVLHRKPYYYFIKKENIISKEELFKRNIEYKKGDLLLSGRGVEQKNIIISFLNEKGFEFSESEVILRSFIDRIKWGLFYKKGYLKFKVKKLNELKLIAEKKNEKICAIDDNIKVITKCIENQIDYILFNLKHNWIVL